MSKEILVNYINEKISDLMETMEETNYKNSCYYGILIGEVSAYKDILIMLDELKGDAE